MIGYEKQEKRVSMKKDKLLVEGELFSLENLKESNNKDKKRARSEENSPIAKDDSDANSLGKDTGKLGKKKNINNMETYITSKGKNKKDDVNTKALSITIATNI
ncbi:hypothetical protein LSTR_LSTR006109 [Laodelphax striatellus]|uniref:Uncharacterized protein n=1 Tax=Laodelphax striatellus TaxID=195883 RepID=A0A482WYA7_LAOST|nr:hypothetical protein LSTR_LSTR006109 [Laodelphax striatellus]